MKPMRLWGVAGPYRVSTVAKIDDGSGRDLIGHHCWQSRNLRVLAGIHGIARKSVIWHEWIHGVLADGGVDLAPADAERVCDVLAAALTGSGTKLPVLK